MVVSTGQLIFRPVTSLPPLAAELTDRRLHNANEEAGFARSILNYP